MRKKNEPRRIGRVFAGSGWLDREELVCGGESLTDFSPNELSILEKTELIAGLCVAFNCATLRDWNRAPSEACGWYPGSEFLLTSSPGIPTDELSCVFCEPSLAEADSDCGGAGMPSL